VSLSTRMVVVPMPIVYIMHARWSTYLYRSPQSRAISNISECLPETTPARAPSLGRLDRPIMAFRGERSNSRRRCLALMVELKAPRDAA
jgi:hypothetical protein